MPKAKVEPPVPEPRPVTYRCNKGHQWTSTAGRYKVRIGDAGEIYLCQHCVFLVYKKLFENCGTVSEVKDGPAS